MKILRISGKNLASLASEFCVDFEREPLASTGLFAISGPTGAGKSTLLDALCLALYDATPRLLKVNRNAALLPDVGADTVSALDPRTLLRRGAAEGWAEVDFVGNDELRYRARWGVRRARGKAGGSLQKSNMSLHRLPDLLALGGTKTEVALEIAQRVGLSFEQFTRAVLLAQNEFSAFLKTEENERGELLETLTGSAIYSALSKRAFERYKAEQAAMQQLAGRLADQAPLAAEARAALEQQGALADAVLLDTDQRKTALERQLRWRQQADRLRENQAQAEAALQAAGAERAGAAQRRRAVASAEAAEPARALLAEIIRLEAEQQALQAAQAAGAAQLEHALAARQQAAQAFEQAGADLLAAETALRSAAPQLDSAKALDASIAALAPAHRSALAAREHAARESAQARAASHAKQLQLTQTRAAQQEGAAWLAAHRQHETLAAQWPRWDQLFGQAGQAAALELKLDASLSEAQAATRQAAADDSAAARLLASAAGQQQAAEASRQQAQAALAAFDADQLHRTRQALELRRDSLLAAAGCWNELQATGLRLRQADAQAAQLGGATGLARKALAEAEADAAPLSAAEGQAERALNAAELACADSVEDLRATLADDQPCPVCGSEQHPYQHQNARLHILLATLRAQLESCRAKVGDNRSEQAAQRALAEAGERQLAALARERAALDQALDAGAARWQAHPLAGEAPPEAQRGSWLAAELDAIKAQSQQQGALEQAARGAALARDTAQQACDQAAAGHARQQALTAAAATALAKAHAGCQALTEQRAQAAASLAALLGELDVAFDDGGWQDQWRREPAPYRAARATEAGQWNQQSSQQGAHAAALIALEAEHGAATLRLAQADTIALQAEAGFAGIDADIGAKQRDRQALWDGRPVAELERAFGAAIDAARTALAQQQATSRAAAEAETRVRQALAHGSERSEAVASASIAASAALDGWLTEFALRHPDLDAPADRPALAALLALPPQTLAQERGALAALDGAAARAEAVLAERRARHEQHLLDPAAAGAEALPAAELAASLLLLEDERKQAHDAATALRLQLAQDEARRSGSRQTLAALEQQQLSERRWGRLSELIGSADGKKFRNYAQQFTLDLLLGYANIHLAQLARRYRLERVANPAGPSLGLMVRDQDMGGEVRSVNSLSGGESFLVSLALALGLASLSSNRVRVESLFIDEGFGSLDSDTLRVAMDALDGLQSMGRKVGVISHVQEMTERIATRVVVQPSGAGSSSVTVL